MRRARAQLERALPFHGHGWPWATFVANVAGAALGGVGAVVVRYRFDALVQSRVRGAFPLGTLAVNLAGTFALGLLAGAGVAVTRCSSPEPRRSAR